MSATAVSEFDLRDAPPRSFIDQMSARFETERETDELLVRKLERRSGPAYQRLSLDDLSQRLHGLLSERIEGPFEVSERSWFTGGVSKIQMGFTLSWNDAKQGPRRERLVVRMDPSESLNTTSRKREFELLQLFNGVVPVPQVFWLDGDAKYFPEPALIYSFVPGVTKPKQTETGKVSGLGTVFGKRLRELLAPQFMQHLAAIHTLDVAGRRFETMDVPEVGSTLGNRWQLDRALRVWEEDRGEDFPLMEVAANWLRRNLPTLDHVSVVHGDFRSGNFLFDEASGRIDAWLDWERGHLGDRHRDLAWLTQAAMGHWEDGVYYVCGLVPQAEFFDRYEQACGLKVDPERLDYYRILNGFQILVSTMATNYRVARLGKSHQDILLARVRGLAPSVAVDLARMLKERL
ncbi:MAG TPA: phosphotransferase family protein [Variovorax sp.]|nr:phosphotransferase family protein [Variovorax sp.]